MTGAQLRAARALLDWSGRRLAAESKVSHMTIHRAEREGGEVRMTAANQEAIQRALEAAGIVLIEADGNGGPGVRLKSAITRPA